MKPQRPAALPFIFVTILIDVIGLGIILPVLPTLIEQLSGKGIGEAARYGGYLTFAYAAAQFFCAPVVGGLSDRFGRRPVLLASLLGLGIDYVFLALAPTLGWLFVGRVLAGVAGASFTTATAYIADVSPPEKRAQNFGLVGAAFGLGFIVGPLIGGAVAYWGARLLTMLLPASAETGSVVAHWATRLPFVVAAGLSLLNFLYGLLLVPESLPEARRRPFEWKRANALASLTRLQLYPQIIGLVVALVLLYLAGSATQSVWTFYSQLKFHWNAQMISYSLGAVGVGALVVQGGLVRLLLPKLGTVRAVVIGLLCYLVGFVLFALAGQSWHMFAITGLYSLGGLAGPALQGSISGQVPADEQGELQGTLTSLISATGVVGPLLMTTLFAYFTGKAAPVYLPGAPFLLGAVLTALALLIAAGSLRRLPAGAASLPPAAEATTGH